MATKLFEIPEIGQVEIAKHHRAKRITLKLKPGKSPKVVIPSLMTYKMGLSFAIEKSDWIVKHKKKLDKLAPNLSVFKNASFYKTRFSTIKIFHQGNVFKTIKHENEIRIFVPAHTPIEHKDNQSQIKNIIIEVLRSEAKQHLIPRVSELASKFGFSFNKVFIKNLKTRWGSCSAVNNINLNLHLMRLPEYLSDFIILHELCHTIHKNHGPKFHELLDTVSGNEKLLNKQIRNYRIDF